MREPDTPVGDRKPALVVAQRAEVVFALEPRGVSIFIAVLSQGKERLEVVVQRFEGGLQNFGVDPPVLGVLLLQVGKGVRLLHIPDVLLIGPILVLLIVLVSFGKSEVVE